jgi:hypothetical protein
MFTPMRQEKDLLGSFLGASMSESPSDRDNTCEAVTCKWPVNNLIYRALHYVIRAQHQIVASQGLSELLLSIMPQ